MRKVVPFVIIAALGLYAFQRHQADNAGPLERAAPPMEMDLVEAPAAPAPAEFRCDGREYCSQMRSCEEARWHLGHCPGMKMDGDKDGVPCESQWCPGG